MSLFHICMTDEAYSVQNEPIIALKSLPW